MTRDDLIEILSNITFVCVDEPEEGDWPIKQMAEHYPGDAANYLESRSSRWDKSTGTKLAMQKYYEDPTWDNFHSAIHYILVDKIIHFLRTGEGLNIRTAVNTSLNCGVVSQEVVDALLSLTSSEQEVA